MSVETPRHSTSVPTWKQSLSTRMGEPAFWVIQLGVIAISAVHFGWEAGWILSDGWEALAAAHHIPVILYLIPVSYAGLVYGWEGGVLTGLWAGAFATLNVLTFSREGFAWVLEIGFAALVLGMGIAMAWPVERERLQRRRAESAASRLEALNEMALVGSAAGSAIQATRRVVDRLVEMSGLVDAAFVLWRSGGHDPLIEVTYQRESPLLALARENRDVYADEPRYLATDSILKTTVTAGDVTANLVVDSASEGFDHGEQSSFLSAVAHQLAVQIENAVLQEHETTMMANYVRLATEAQEEERRRLARDLHDGPAQQLAILVRRLEGVETQTVSDTGLHASASEILGELRRVARDQRPTLLDDLGIAPALEWLVSDTDKRTDASLTLRINGPVRRPLPGTEVALFRIAQEALRNAERHSNATRVSVTLDFRKNGIELSVSDNGIGFRSPGSAGDYLDSGRLGLMGMHERADLVGGSLLIESATGSGTTVTALVPESSSVGSAAAGSEP